MDEATAFTLFEQFSWRGLYDTLYSLDMPDAAADAKFLLVTTQPTTAAIPHLAVGRRLARGRHSSIRSRTSVVKEGEKPLVQSSFAAPLPTYTYCT